MSKLFAGFASLAAAALVACSSADQGPDADTSSADASAPVPNSAPDSGNESGTGCPGASAEKTKTPSPAERCEGGYSASRYPQTPAEEYLHSDGESCVLGPNKVLHLDGRVTPMPGYTFAEGTWRGDAVYFEVKINDTTTYYSPLAKK